MPMIPNDEEKFEAAQLRKSEQRKLVQKQFANKTAADNEAFAEFRAQMAEKMGCEPFDFTDICKRDNRYELTGLKTITLNRVKNELHRARQNGHIFAGHTDEDLAGDLIAYSDTFEAWRREDLAPYVKEARK